MVATVISSYGFYCCSAATGLKTKAGVLAALGVVLAGTPGGASYRLLETPHPWRAGAMKGFGMEERRM